ncbi:keratin-associated protein 10-7-like [Macrobrachium nipponense]|uniref:keratin-associated protein 10-7-like n=1 Tax=Macrobrachium nipponense TaxID=159736 RepID=UPI0030C7CB55
MLRNSLITSLLFLGLFLTELAAPVQGAADISAGNGTKYGADTRDICTDSACTTKKGTCRSFLSSCRELDDSLCGILCSCCVPCSGTCGTANDGTCKSTCTSTEEQIPGCTGRNCRCCRALKKCGTGSKGLCKSSCSTSTETTDTTGTCTVSGYKCCVPKTGCTAKCGFLNKYTCITSSQCPIWKWRPGTCRSGCQCCA